MNVDEDRTLGYIQRTKLDLLRLAGRMPMEIMTRHSDGDTPRHRETMKGAIAGLRRRGLIVERDGYAELAPGVEVDYPLPRDTPPLKGALANYRSRRSKR